MSYRACFQCDLLFEVREGDGNVCTQCGGTLVDHHPPMTPAQTQPVPEESEPGQEPTRMISMSPDGQIENILPTDEKQADHGIDTGTNLIGPNAKTKDRRSIHRRKDKADSKPRERATDSQGAPSLNKGIHTGTNLIDSRQVGGAHQTSSGPELEQTNPGTHAPLEQTRMIPRREVENLGSRNIATGALEATSLVKTPSQPEDENKPSRIQTQDSSQESIQGKTPNERIEPANHTGKEQETSSPQPDVPDARFTGGTVPDAIAQIVNKGLAEAEQPPLDATRQIQAPRSLLLRRLLYGCIFIGLTIIGLDHEEPKKQRTRAQVTVSEQVAPSMIDILERVGIEPFAGRVSEPADCDAYVVAGLETIELSGGPIPGLGSGRVADALISSDPDGPWIQQLTRQLEKSKLDEPDTLCIALDNEATAHELFVFGHSAQRAGFRRTGLLLKDASGQIELGILPYRTRIPTLARNARIVIRMGRLGVYTEVIEPDGARRGERLAPIGLLNESELNHEQVDARLAMLKETHSDIRIAVVEVNRDLSIEKTARLFEHASIGTEGERFSRIQLRLR